MIPGTKIMKHEVMVGNDIRGRQNSVVPRQVGIACQRNAVAEARRASASRVHAVLRHRSHDDEMDDSLFSKLLLERGFEERVRFPLPDDAVAIGWLKQRINLPAPRMDLQRMRRCRHAGCRSLEPPRRELSQAGF